MTLPAASLSSAPTRPQVACSEPEAHAQRPLTTRPPSTRRVSSDGVSTPHTRASGSAPKIVLLGVVVVEAHEPVADVGQRQHPARRPVALGHRGGDLELGRDVDLVAAEALRNRDPESAARDSRSMAVSVVMVSPRLRPRSGATQVYRPGAGVSAEAPRARRGGAAGSAARAPRGSGRARADRRRARRRADRAGAAARPSSSAGSGSRRARAVDHGQRRLGRAGLRHGDGAVELDHRRAGDAGQLAVERRDLGPVDVRLGLQRGDRRLQDVDPPAAAGASAIARSRAARPCSIRPASHSERSWSASSTSSSSAKRAARRESWHSISASSPWASGSSGMRTVSRRPRRIASSASSRRSAVALVEDQVDHRQHRRQAVGEQVVGAAPRTGSRPP